MNLMRRVPVLVCALLVAWPAIAANPQAAENVGDPVPVAPAKIVPSDKATKAPHVPQAILLDEYTGKFITNPTGGFGGAPLSALTAPDSLFGFGHQVTAPNRMADDFVVPAGGWSVEKITFYAYQTGSTTTSTITDVRLQIRSGVPPGGPVVYGDTTTNRLSSTSWTGVYRAQSTAPTNATRPVMAAVVNIVPPLALPPGTYWMVWNMGGTLASGPWAPPQVPLSGNALQEVSTSPGVFNPAMDTGSGLQKGMPFIIEGVATPVELQAFEVQ